MTNVVLTVNGERREADVEPRQLLVYLLRDQLGLKGTNVGCDTSSCGACTVLLDGERVLSCLTLAVQASGRQVRTIEGLAGDGEQLHPLQQAFIDQDGFQCGYCTPGQICSALGMLEELRRGEPSHVTADLSAGPAALTRDELRERMSGNLCRCGAHNGIVDAIMAFADGTGAK